MYTFSVKIDCQLGLHVNTFYKFCYRYGFMEAQLYVKNYSALWSYEQTLTCKDRNRKLCIIREPLQDSRDHTTVVIIAKIKYVSVTN